MFEFDLPLLEVTHGFSKARIVNAGNEVPIEAENERFKIRLIFDYQRVHYMIRDRKTGTNLDLVKLLGRYLSVQETTYDVPMVEFLLRVEPMLVTAIDNYIKQDSSFSAC